MQRQIIYGQRAPYLNLSHLIRCPDNNSGVFGAVSPGGDCHVSKQCITVILTSQADGVEFFTPSFPILFETALSTPATTQQNPRE